MKGSMNNLFKFFMFLLGFGRRSRRSKTNFPTNLPEPVPDPVPADFVPELVLPVTMEPEEVEVAIPITAVESKVAEQAEKCKIRKDLTCVPAGPKKVRYITRRGQQMTAEVADRSGNGEVFLRRPGHRLGPVFRGFLVS